MSHLVMVAYDVADNRRRRRVAKILEDYGVRVQKSVFECDLDQSRLTNLIVELRRAVNRKRDKIRCFPLCLDCRGRRGTHGRPCAPLRDGGWLVF